MSHFRFDSSTVLVVGLSLLGVSIVMWVVARPRRRIILSSQRRNRRGGRSSEVAIFAVGGLQKRARLSEKSWPCYQMWSVFEIDVSKSTQSARKCLGFPA
jgi:hypothetical protein